MGEKDFYVPMSISEVVAKIKGQLEESLTMELISEYQRTTPQGNTLCVLVLEKHYFRVGNRLTLTVVMDDWEKRTHIHAVSGGGSESFFTRNDWGAGEDFLKQIEKMIAKEE